MSSLKERASARADDLRERASFVDHVVRMFGHYSDRGGNAQAGAVTYFGFLSFFPILALAFAVVGWVSTVYPELRADVMATLEDILPGVVGSEDGEIPLSTFEEYGGTVGLLGLVGVVYAGLGWVSGMRDALAVMFKLPRSEHPNFILGKGRDLLTLAVLGIVLLVSISLSGAVAWFSGLILDWVGLADSWLAAVVLGVVTYALAIGAAALLFLAMFSLLAKPHVPRRALWQGSLAGALGFEVLKAAAGFLIGLTKEQPAFQAFGVALILLVWINYFSRLVMLSASWAYTARVAEGVRALERQPLVAADEVGDLAPEPAVVVAEDPEDAPLPEERRRRRRTQQVGLISAAGVVAVAVLTWLGRRGRA